MVPTERPREPEVLRNGVHGPQRGHDQGHANDRRHRRPDRQRPPVREPDREHGQRPPDEQREEDHPPKDEAGIAEHPRQHAVTKLSPPQRRNRHLLHDGDPHRDPKPCRVRDSEPPAPVEHRRCDGIHPRQQRTEQQQMTELPMHEMPSRDLHLRRPAVGRCASRHPTEHTRPPPASSLRREEHGGERFAATGLERAHAVVAVRSEDLGGGTARHNLVVDETRATSIVLVHGTGDLEIAAVARTGPHALVVPPAPEVRYVAGKMPASSDAEIVALVHIFTAQDAAVFWQRFRRLQATRTRVLPLGQALRVWITDMLSAR